MAILNNEGLEFYDNALKHFLLDNYATRVQCTIALNTAKEAKLMLIEKTMVPATTLEILEIFINSDSVPSLNNQ